MHSAGLSELQERLFWQEQNSLAVLFVALWSVDILKEQLQKRQQYFNFFFFPLIGRFACKHQAFPMSVSCN